MVSHHPRQPKYKCLTQVMTVSCTKGVFGATMSIRPCILPPLLSTSFRVRPLELLEFLFADIFLITLNNLHRRVTIQRFVRQLQLTQSQRAQISWMQLSAKTIDEPFPIEIKCAVIHESFCQSAPFVAPLLPQSIPYTRKVNISHRQSNYPSRLTFTAIYVSVSPYSS